MIIYLHSKNKKLDKLSLLSPRFFELKLISLHRKMIPNGTAHNNLRLALLIATQGDSVAPSTYRGLSGVLSWIR